MNPEESSRSQPTNKNAAMNHNSSTSLSLASFHNSFGSFDEESYSCDESTLDNNDNYHRHMSEMYQEWLKEHVVSNEDAIQILMDRLHLDLDLVDAASTSSILTDDDDIHDSLQVTRRRRGNLFNATTSEQEESNEDKVSIESKEVVPES
jgi:hypothetical protein